MASNRSASHQAAVLHNEGLIKLQAGDRGAALSLLRQALALDPAVAAYHINLAIALKGHGSDSERVSLYRRALELEPQDPITHTNMASVLTDTGDFKAAEKHARKALELAPGRVEALMNLGGALAGQKRYKEAAVAFDAVLHVQPDALPVLLSSGKAYRAAGMLDAAIARFRDARKQFLERPELSADDRTNICRMLGEALSTALDYAGAEQQYREALRYCPHDTTLLVDLGNELTTQGKLAEAESCSRKAVEGMPRSPGARVGLGIVLHMLGNYEEALAQFRVAQTLDPLSLMIYSNIGTSLTYSPTHGPAELKRIYDEFDRLVARPMLDPRPHTNNRDRQRRLRIGYLSPDFRKHVVAYFALPLLEGHRREHVEVVCYYNHRQHDEWTQRFKETADEWVDCVDMRDSELAERIRADRIDILVDLAGHTQGHRLRVIARKPAPVQVTWMGYVTTTGMSAIDYRLTHADCDPSGTDGDYAETLIRLEGTPWCFRPLPGMPEVSPPPFQRNGFITFGSFNRFSKISPNVLDCWASILAAVSRSRLVLCVPEGKIRHDVVARFAAHGVSAERLSFFAKLSHPEFWSLHADVDIALDPYPFNGGTTSYESLWLGVPLISCRGGVDSFIPRFASRMGYTFLKAVGLPELATTSEAAYAHAAIDLANDTDRLAHIRMTLRERMARSPLTDEIRFVTEVEAAYRQIWTAWAADQ